MLKNYGIRETDPRLEPMMCKIREIEAEKEERVNEARDPKHWKLSREDFKRVISEGCKCGNFQENIFLYL